MRPNAHDNYRQPALQPTRDSDDQSSNNLSRKRRAAGSIDLNELLNPENASENAPETHNASVTSESDRGTLRQRASRSDAVRVWSYPQLPSNLRSSADRETVEQAAAPSLMQSAEPQLKRRKTSQSDWTGKFTIRKFTDLVKSRDCASIEACIESSAFTIENLSNETRTKALILMVSYGSRDAVRRLLRQGVDPNGRDGSNRETALIVAAQLGNHPIVCELLEHGAKTELATRYSSSTALHLAASAGHHLVVGELIKAGAAVGKVNKGGENALTHTALSLLTQAPNSSSVRDPGAGYMKVITLLVRAGANINQPLDDRRYTLLHMLVEAGLSQHIRSMLEEGADPGAKTASGLTVIDLARQKGDRQVLLALNIADAAISEQNPEPEPLPSLVSHQPAQSPQPFLRFRQLQQHDLAEQSRQVHSVQRPRPPEQPQRSQQSQPAQSAQPARRRISPATAALMEVVRVGNFDLVCSLLADGGDLDINHQNEHGDTPLMLALSKGNLQIAKLLLSANANPYIVQKEGRTSAFTIAAMKGQVEIISMMIETPSFRSLKEIAGVDALCAAIQFQQVEVIRRLVNAGVDPGVVGAGGESGLMVLERLVSSKVLLHPHLIRTIFGRVGTH